MPKKNEAKQTTLFSGGTAPKKAAPKKASKAAPKPAAEKQQPVNVVVNLTVPKEKKESNAMAKRKQFGPAGNRKARAAARKAARARNAKLTAGHTGKMGGTAFQKTYGGQPRERSGPNYTTIVLTDPKSKNKRKVAVGPKGGVYAQKKWEKKWIAAVPLAAAAATGAAYLGMKLKDQPTIAQWSTWYPGGYTGMALTAGGVGAYVAYKNRYMVGVIAGSIILFYAFIKLAMAKITGYEESHSSSSPGLPGSSSSSSASVDDNSEPNATQNLPSAKEKAEEAFEAGDEEYKNGNFKAAISHYEEALAATNDALIFYSIAQAYRRMASGIDDKTNANARKAAKNAIFYYKMFINNAKANEIVSASDLATYKGRAAQFVDSLNSLYFKTETSVDDEPIPVQGTRIGAAMDDEDDDIDEVLEESAGEEEDDDQEDELVEGVYSEDQIISGDEDEDENDEVTEYAVETD